MQLPCLIARDTPDSKDIYSACQGKDQESVQGFQGFTPAEDTIAYTRRMKFILINMYCFHYLIIALRIMNKVLISYIEVIIYRHI